MPLKEAELKRFFLALLLSSVMFVIGCNSPKVEATIEKNQAGFNASLNSHLILVVPEAEKVKFVSDGSLGVGNWGEPGKKEFVLGIGEKFQSLPDHHASTVFEVKEIKRTGVVLKYLSTFDHRSFGKNLISKDEGQVEITFKGKK